MENLKNKYDFDINNFISIVKRFNYLQEVDILGAFKLHKDALVAYDRWSFILCEYKNLEGKNINVKVRIEEMLKVLNNIYVSSRMVWSKGKDDINKY